MNKELREKIEDLFALRRLPELLNHCDSKHEASIEEQLIALQKSIYDLDLLLETSWKISHTDLSKKWQNIFSDLRAFGLSNSQMDDYTSAIKRYQKHELQLRQGKLPIEYTLEYYYYYKSCDVKLLRRLLYEHTPQLEKLYPQSEWRIFDLITEIYDDVEDVFEDMETINGNAFMLNINSRGLKATVDLYQDFINELEFRLEERLGKAKAEGKKQIYNWTKEAIMHLNILMLKQSEKIKSEPKRDCLVIETLSIEYSV